MLKEEKNVTVTLDIGTVHGIIMVATLFICGDKCFLVNKIPMTYKKGKDKCFESCQLYGYITKEVLKKIIALITGDGTFAKGHKPFKNQMQHLVGKEPTITWDLLHLINREQI